jgi:glutamine amidotransferase
MTDLNRGSVIVLDYGAGNLRSVVRAVEYVAPGVRGDGGEPIKVEVTDDFRALEGAQAVVLPGVGAAEDTMTNLASRGLIDPIKEYIRSGRPFLGVCMGLQALMTASEEGGEHPCLDTVPGRVVRLPDGLKVPHMGWNALHFTRSSPVLDGIPDGSYVYFLHSYYCVPEDPSVVLATASYGATITAMVEKDNVVATQFHPEKSGAHGLRIYRNFLQSAVLQSTVPQNTVRDEAPG